MQLRSANACLSEISPKPETVPRFRQLARALGERVSFPLEVNGEQIGGNGGNTQHYSA